MIQSALGSLLWVWITPVVPLVVAATLLAGPQGNVVAQTPKPTFRLVSDQELAALEKEIMTVVERNQRRKCPRPALRGTATAGSADKDMIACVEGDRELKRCFQLLKKSSDQFSEALYLQEGDKLPNGRSQRYWNYVRPLHDPKASVTDTRKLLATCAPLIARSRAATQHADACSPYLPGRRGIPSFVQQLRLTKLVALKARALLAQGKVRSALELMLDNTRFNQDMMRGGVSLIVSMIAVACDGLLLPFFEQALNTPKPLGDQLLGQLDRELQLLLRGEAGAFSLLEGEHHYTILTMVLPGVKPPGWTPPGGWGSEQPPAPASQTGTISMGLSREQEWGLIWLAGSETFQLWKNACPPTASHQQCFDGLNNAARGIASKMQGPMAKIARLLKTLTAKDQVKAVRRQIIDILKVVATPAFSKYIRRHGHVVFMFAALRLHVAYRRLAEQQKSCPKLSAFDQKPLKDLRANPVDGLPIVVRPLGKAGEFLLSQQTPLAPEEKRGEPGVVVVCPFVKSTAGGANP